MGRAGATGIAICRQHFDDLFPVIPAITAIKPSIKVLAMTCDTTNAAEVVSLFSAAMERLGNLDVMVSNVGIAKMGEGDEDGWWEDVTGNLRSTHLIAHQYPWTLDPCGTGIFISVSAGADNVVVPGLSSYGIAKQAVRHLVGSFAVEYPGLKAFELDAGIVRTTSALNMNKGFGYDNPELAGMMSVWLGGRRADHLSGTYVHVTWDIEEMETCSRQRAGTGAMEQRLLEGILGQYQNI
jgi:NAD(P)-dependent dehydrogenase (short-subunit alcohol dehydrogenase family)